MPRDQHMLEDPMYRSRTLVTYFLPSSLSISEARTRPGALSLPLQPTSVCCGRSRLRAQPELTRNEWWSSCVAMDARLREGGGWGRIRGSAMEFIQSSEASSICLQGIAKATKNVPPTERFPTKLTTLYLTCTNTCATAPLPLFPVRTGEGEGAPHLLFA